MREIEESVWEVMDLVCLQGNGLGGRMHERDKEKCKRGNGFGVCMQGNGLGGRMHERD